MSRIGSTTLLLSCKLVQPLWKTVRRFLKKLKIEIPYRDFPGGAVVKNPPANAGNMGLSLVLEDPTCLGATKPVSHNYRAYTLEPTSHNYRAYTLEPASHNY